MLYKIIFLKIGLASPTPPATQPPKSPLVSASTSAAVAVVPAKKSSVGTLSTSSSASKSTTTAAASTFSNPSKHKHSLMEKKRPTTTSSTTTTFASEREKKWANNYIWRQICVFFIRNLIAWAKFLFFYNRFKNNFYFNSPVWHFPNLLVDQFSFKFHFIIWTFRFFKYCTP